MIGRAMETTRSVSMQTRVARAPRRKPAVKAPPRPRRGRPTAEQAAAIDRAILAAATERFLAEGYAATSMEAVAAAAAVSKGTLYARYPTKEALLRAVFEARVAVWSAAATARDPRRDDRLELRLRHHAETIVRAMGSTEIRAFEQLLDGASGRFPELGRVLYEHGYQLSLRLLTQEIIEGTREDAVPARNPQRVAETLLGALSGWYRSEQLVRPVSQRKALAFAKTVVDLIVAGRAAW